MHQRMGLNLPSSKPSETSWSRYCPSGSGWVAVLVLAHLLAVLLVDGFSLIHTVIYNVHKQAHNKEKEIKVLSLSSNREQLRYEDRSDIFGRFSNGTAEFMLGMAW